MDRYWVPHDHLVFAPCELKRKDAQTVTFADENGEVLSIPIAKFAGLPKVLESQTRGVDNVCMLEEVNPPSLLHTVRSRYFRGQIYTRVARILISVNPFRPLPIYTSQAMSRYLSWGDSLDLNPHIYGIGLDAVRGLQTSLKSQVVLISGESGAGKTESTKQVMSYLAEAVGGHGGVQEKIVRTNPVLEAFGNAMTVRNNNSSRFGKFLEVWVDNGSHQIEGCSVTDYLLEVTRVCNQSESERNYHIFFQLLSSRSQALLKDIGLLEAKKYRYLEASQATAPGIDDVRCFEELREALSTLYFSDCEQLQIFKVVAGILTLGNCDFVSTEADGSEVSTEEALTQAADLFGVKSDTLRQAMTVKKIYVGREVTDANRNVQQARDARDSLSRLIYGRLFKWLIKRMNSTLSDGATPGQFFGVLDIAGFESFGHNSLEQLFINLSNEHLQQHFNTHVFKAELAEYEAEGISIGGGIEFKDNSDVVALLDAKGGILPALDEEVALPKGTDLTFVSKVLKAHEKNKRFIVPKFGGSNSMRFGIRHFAGEVQYECTGFLKKNIDKPPEEAPALLQSSKVTILCQIGRMIVEELADGAGSRGSKKAKTVSTGFRASLAALMDKLNSAEPHFVRCIKPNAGKLPEQFDSHLALEQLVNSGVMEAIFVRQRGFATRMTFKEFIYRYRIVARSVANRKLSDCNSTERDSAQAIVEAVSTSLGIPTGFKIGKTKVLLTGELNRAMEKRRDLSIVGYAVHIQRIFRGKRARRVVASCKSMQAELDVWCDRNKAGSASASARTLDVVEDEARQGRRLVEQAKELPFKLPKLSFARNMLARVAEQVTVLRQLEALATSVDPVEIEKTLARATELELPRSHLILKLSDRCKLLKTQLPLVTAMKDGIAKADLERLQEVFDALKKSGLHMSPDMWVPELGGVELAGRTYDTIEALKSKRKLQQIESQRRASLEKDVFDNKINEQCTFEEEEKPAPEPPKPSKKNSRRRTITGLTEQRQEEVLSSLRQAMQQYDGLAMEQHLGVAVREGIQSELREEAEQLLGDLQSGSFVKTNLGTGVERVKANRHCTTELRSLQNLVQQARRIGIDPESLVEAQTELLLGLKQVASRASTGKLFEEADRQDLEKITLDLELSDFKGLKPQDQWRGHRGADTVTRITALLSNRHRRGESMLCHHPTDIKEALTQVPSNLEGSAKMMFHDILGWMGDRAVSANERQGYAQGIVDLAMSHTALADEAYVQVLKQLTGNPSPRSILCGGQLLLLFTQQVRPSTELEEYVRSFLLKATGSTDDEQAALARQCLADLNQTIAVADGRRVTNEPADADMSVQVHLMDNSTRRLRTSQWVKLGELTRQVAEQLRIHNAKDFCFFQMTDGMESHRMLPDEASLGELMNRWNKLKATTGRASHLLFKRRFLRADETLDAGDLVHATLTYRQAVWDYLNYPVSEDSNLIRRIAAVLCSIEDPTTKDTLDQPGVLERFLPEQVLKDQKRAHWVRQVEATARADEEADPDETKLLKMGRVLKMMQKMQLFGAHYWLGRQTLRVPEDRVSVPEAPSDICQINPRYSEAEYWICVDPCGIRFVSVDSAPGQSFARGFLFDTEAMERLLQWGAKGNVTQFVVQSVNTSAKTSDRRAPMTISMVTPAAIDIAFVVHCVTAEREKASNATSERGRK